MPDSFTDAVEKRVKGFDPEGEGYDEETAKAHKLKPDETGHWPSRSPVTGQLLKGRKHKTWHKTEEGEANAGFTIYKDSKSGRYFSTPQRLKGPTRAKTFKGEK